MVQRKTPKGPFAVSSLWVAPSAARSMAPPPPRGCATQVQIAPSRCQLWGGGDGVEGSSGQKYPPCVASHPLLQVPCVEASVSTGVMLAPQVSPYLAVSPSDTWEMALGPPAARSSTGLPSGRTLRRGWPVCPPAPCSLGDQAANEAAVQLSVLLRLCALLWREPFLLQVFHLGRAWPFAPPSRTFWGPW